MTDNVNEIDGMLDLSITLLRNLRNPNDKPIDFKASISLIWHDLGIKSCTIC